MRTCKLRVAFAQQKNGAKAGHTPATFLGQACHDALDRLVREGALLEDDWLAATELAWQSAIASLTERAPELSDPERIPGYQIKRVRLRNVAGRMRELLTAPEATGADVLPEEPFEAADGRLYGRPDLILLGPTVHRIIDYKTGSIHEHDSGDVKAAYVRQLQLYAFLEHERSGSWPDSAHLLPLTGQAVEVNVTADQCESTAREALDLLAKFNAAVPGPQPASPSPGACGYCPYAPRCPEFWSACDPTWSPGLNAVAGVVTKVFRTDNGLVTLTVRPSAGTIDSDEVVLWNIAPHDHSDASLAAPGKRVGAVSLRLDESRGVFVVPPWGSLRVDVDGPLEAS
jgi:RecB family exonuclease